MKLYNTLTKQAEEFKPLDSDGVRMYSCGPTVYNHIHIGNLSAFIYADTLRRVLTASGYKVTHVMNFTDVDDKTIRRSGERYPDMSAEEALQTLTREYEDVFLHDMSAIGNDVDAVGFVRATDSIEGMRELITDLYKDGFAYLADDGVYFSIDTYRKSGKTYGQLTEITAASTSEARIQNDEYDKESVHDFALWKTQKEGEPAWPFELDGHDLTGRPGWHIECSVMSVAKLGQPFDIHTGGVDLIFPHHENEIAQSTAGGGDVYAKCFVHNEHLLVDGKKMSKSLGNFFTLRDIQERGFDPLAFRLMVLQSHYRSQSNFTWDNLEAAQNRLRNLRQLAQRQFQDDPEAGTFGDGYFENKYDAFLRGLAENLDTALAWRVLGELESDIERFGLHSMHIGGFRDFLAKIDAVFGLQLLDEKDISDQQKLILKQRLEARNKKDWTESDKLRDQLAAEGIGIKDTDRDQIWYRL